MREVDLIGRIETPITLNARMNANAVTTTNYNELGNKPKINGVTLYGDLTPEELGIFYGAPFVANTVAEMTNTDKVYVYTGSETGYVAGNWYYYNGSEWVSGGVYNSAAVQTDRTLTQEDKAADAKAVGDALAMKAGIIEDTVTGEIVSFVPDKTIDKLLDASLEMSPIQSLNGYDSPWPGGGGKNKFNVTQTTQTVSGVTVTISSDGVISLSGTASAIVTLVLGYFTPEANTSYYVSGSPFATNACRLQFQEGSTTVANQYNNADALVENLNTTQHRIRLYIANETNVNGVTIKPMIRLASESDATFAPYSNICPISGHAEAKLQVRGLNLIKGTAESVTSGGVTFAMSGTGEIAISGTSTGRYTQAAISTLRLPVGTTVTLSSAVNNVPAGAFVYAMLYERDSATGDNMVGHSTRSGASQTFTLAHPYQLLLIVAEMSGVTYAGTVAYIQLEVGSSASAFEDSEGDTYSVTFPETIYGGSHEFVSGKATAAMAKYTFTGANVVGFYKEGNLWRVTITGINYGANNNYKKGLCDRYTMQTSYDGVNRNNNSIGFNSSDSTQILIRDDTITNTNLRDLLNANPLEVVYPLATPLEYTLSPQQLTTLQGQNVVWGNGTATVKYAADAKTYIDNKIAAAVAALS